MPIDRISSELGSVIEKAKGQLDYLLTPWSLLAWSDVRSFLFAYKASNRCDGICRVERFFLPDGRVAVICKQIPDNPGQSVTNSIEEIAFQICVQFKIEALKLVLIDYYPSKGTLSDDRWSLVSFQHRPPNSMFAGPSWRRMTKEDWRALGLRPRDRKSKGS